LDAATVAALQELGLPAQNPLDMGAAVAPEIAGAALRAVAASAQVDAVLAVFTRVAITDADAMDDAIAAAAERTDKPVVSVEVGAPARTRPLPGKDLPVFSFPEEAAAALGVAYRYARQRAVPIAVPART